MTKENFSFRELMQKSGDTRTVYDKRWKAKEVAINIREKKEELRKTLYKKVAKTKAKRKDLPNEEIIKVLQLEEKLMEEYPHTNNLEKDIILNGLADRIKNL